MTIEQCRRLKHGRILAFYTQHAAADQLAVSIRTYQKWEQGEISPGNIEVLVRIATLFDMSLDWWLTGDGPSPQTKIERQLINGIHQLRPHQQEALNVIISSMVG